MSHGLLIKDAYGRTIMGPETFTVRMVDSRLSNVGRMRVGQTINLPMSSKVKAGMFAIVMPLKQYRVGYTANAMHEADKPACLPSAVVYDGYVALEASGVASSLVDGNVAIYVFTNI